MVARASGGARCRRADENFHILVGANVTRPIIPDTKVPVLEATHLDSIATKKLNRHVQILPRMLASRIDCYLHNSHE